MITVNFNKAKTVTADRLRQERMPKLQDLDVQYQRALETGEDTTDIVAQKQVLRDLPAQVDACTKLTQLKNLRA
jgi:ssDNA-specific exonuclease RecJ